MAYANAYANTSVALSWDGRYAAIVSNDNAIRIWNSATGRPIGQPMTGSEKSIDVAAVSPDGRRVAAQDFNGTLRLWDAETGRQIGSPLSGHDGRVTALAFSRDGRRLASAGLDNTVRRWDASNAAALGEPLRGGDPRLGQEDAMWSVAFSPDGHTIAAGGSTVALGTLSSAGTPLRLWNADTGSAIGGPPVVGDYGRSINAVAFSPDGARIATGGSDKTVRLWDAHTVQPIGPPLRFQAPVSDVAFTRQGNRIVAVSGDTVEVSDADPDAALIRELGGSKAAQLAQGEAAFALYTTMDDPRIAVVRDDTLRWLDPDTGQQRGQTVVSDALRGISQFDVSPDNRWLALAGPDNDVRVVDASTGQLHGAPIKGNDDVVTSVAFSPDGQTLATGSDDKTVRLWDWRSGRQIGEPMKGHELGVDEVAFSPDGRRLYSRSLDSIRIWDTTTWHAVGKPIGGPANAGFSGMAISPDGRRIGAASVNTVNQWDAESGEAAGPPMVGHNEVVEGITYSPDGRYLVSVSADNTLRFWDTASARQIGEPVDTAAVGRTANVDFSRDGRRVFVAARSMSLDGRPPIVGGGIWELPGPGAWIDSLCDKLSSNPSDERWTDWISPDVPYIELCPGKAVRP